MNNFLILVRFLSPSRQKRRVRKVLYHQGEHYNLKEIFDHVNHLYFEGKVDLHITWGGSRTSKPRTRVIFGSYCKERKLIRIHRRLDASHIPLHFISFVVYHEMLHHIHPPYRQGGKRRIHHAIFAEKEKVFKEYALVKAFQKKKRESWFTK